MAGSELTAEAENHPVHKAARRPPLISVVTVTKNSARALSKTIQSVGSQDFDDFEYIVIDGASSDLTAEVLEQSKSGIDCIICEPDNGLYDAMNKGLDRVSGGWVIFLNAGDVFHRADTLSRVEKHLKASPSPIAIGLVENHYPDGFRDVPPFKRIDLRWGMRFSHQATFVRASYHRENRFRLEDGLAADYAFFLRAVRDGVIPFRFNEIVADFDVSGLSSQNYLENIRREQRLYRRYMGAAPLTFAARKLYAGLARAAKEHLPGSVANIVRRMKSA